jgi:hypothetical protein
MLLRRPLASDRRHTTRPRSSTMVAQLQLRCCCLLRGLAALGLGPYMTGAELSVAVYGNTAHAGIPAVNTTVGTLNQARSLLQPWHSAVIQGRITAREWALFSVDTDAGYVRLRVDDHLLIDGGPAAPPAPSCAVPGGDPSALPGFLQWQDAFMPTNGTDDPRSMSNLGGDCTKGCSRSVCQALCAELAPHGCIGFYTHKHQWNFCSMRKLGSAADKWQDVLRSTIEPYTAYTLQAACSADSGFCPLGAPPPPPAVGANGTAGYAIPIPMLPGRTYAKLRLELTLGAVVPTRFALLINSTVVAPQRLSSTVAPAERRYDQERARAEVGWNTWLSTDMLTHAWLPSGVALSISLHQGNATVAALGGQGPSCSASVFPATHGLHAQRGEYTEVESVSVGGEGPGASSFRVESAVSGPGGNMGTELHLVITTLSLPATAPSERTNGYDAPFAVLSLGVPLSYRPRACNVSADAAKLVGRCPGFDDVTVSGADGTALTPAAGPASLRVMLASTVGGRVSFIASASSSVGTRPASVSPVQTVAAARATLLQQLSAYGVHNDTMAGLQASIAWNVIYNPWEGIVTPVFRGMFLSRLATAA